MRSRVHHCSQYLLASLVLSVLCLSAACLKLTPEPVNIVAYALDAKAPAPAGASLLPEGVALKLRHFRVAPMFSGRKLVYHQPGDTWASDYYHEFFIEPAPMLTSVAQQWLADSTGEGQVIQPASLLSPTHVLEGTILELYGEFSSAGPAAAVVALDFLLLESTRSGTPKVMLHKTYRRKVPLTRDTPAALVDGMNAALAEILKNFSADVAKLNFSQSAEPETPSRPTFESDPAEATMEKTEEIIEALTPAK